MPGVSVRKVLHWSHKIPNKCYSRLTMEVVTTDFPLFVFTVAPTGLGHIRVMNALQEGLPPNTPFEVIGLQDAGLNRAHALLSRSPLFSRIFEFYQTHAFVERLFSGLYIRYLQTHGKEAMTGFAYVAKIHPDQKQWVIVSTHFALAFSIAASKQKIKEKFGVDIVLCVIVTDDTQQRAWVVKDADLVFVPSTLTEKAMVELGMPPEKMRVVSYPVSPKFAQKLSTEEYQHVLEQLDPHQTVPLQIVIPISGAAVQLPYLVDIIETLSYGNFFFTVVGEDSPFTSAFFAKITQMSHVQTSIGMSNLETVEYYESLFYQPSRPAVEITKPSEQTFKALLEPNERGGVILLFTQPVGRQERDNLSFLQRHGLIPNETEQQTLEGLLLSDKKLSIEEAAHLHELASHWRGIQLPANSHKAALLIKRLKQEGVFSAMLSYVPVQEKELMSNGVEMIWNEIQKFTVGEQPSSTARATSAPLHST